MTVTIGFEILAHDGAARLGRLTTAHGTYRDAGLHAGRHRRDGQGDDPGGGRRDRRAHRARQHLPSDAAARRRAHRGAGRAAPLHELAARDPDRFRRLPGHVAGGAAQDHRGGGRVPLASRRQPPSADPGALGRDPAPARRRHHDGVRRMHAVPGRARGRSKPRWNCRCAGPSARAPPSSQRPGHGIFGIVQGGVHPDLRARSAARLVEIGFDGYAIGGLAIGEGQATTFAMVEATVPGLPADRPRYLMGVGKPADIVGAVKRGVDMFDCVLPTRSGPHRPGLHPRRHAEPAQRPPCRRPGAARPGTAAARLAPASAGRICII